MTEARAEVLVVEAKPAEPEAPQSKPGNDNPNDVHYADLHKRLNDSLRAFRESGEVIGLLLVENIKFNRDKLAEYVDKFEELMDSIPPMDEMRKFLEGIASVRDEIRKFSDGIDEKIRAKIEESESITAKDIDEIRRQVYEQNQLRAVQARDPAVEASMQQVELLRNQLLDLNNRFTTFNEQHELLKVTVMSNKAQTEESASVQNRRISGVEDRLVALERRPNGSID